MALGVFPDPAVPRRGGTELVYLAGKIRKDCWRHTIVRGLRDAWTDSYGNLAAHSWPVLRGSVLDGLADYAGPYFVSCDHGCAHSPVDGRTHGLTGGCIETTGAPGSSAPTAREVARRSCLAAVRSSTLVFAYIDEPDAFGTLHELGYAEALGKRTVICLDPALGEETIADLWFASATRDRAATLISDDPAGALRAALDHLAGPKVTLESEAERRYWTAHREIGDPLLTGLVTQHPASGYRLDFALPPQRIAVEIDGHAYHSGPDVFTRDRVRQRHLELAGWRVVRFSGREACNDPHRCVRETAAFVRRVATGTR